MPFLTSPEYDYSYDKSISSPLKRQRNQDGEVRRTKDNIRPPHGFAQVDDAVAGGPRQRFIYTLRHGKAQHNALSREFSKAISWRFLGKLANNFDPGLTADGVDDARDAGRLLAAVVRDEGAPRPLAVYTSPLRRCIQTAMHTIAALRLAAVGEGEGEGGPPPPPPPRVTLHVKEGLREWKGYDHDHQSDRRDVTPNIARLVAGLRAELGLADDAVELRLDGAQDAEDPRVMRETYVDVDRRVRRVLDDIFDGGGDDDDDDDDGDGNGCAMLVLHNRSNKSVLRVLGHRQAEVHKLDMENCAVLGYLVGRRALDGAEAAGRRAAEAVQWRRDRDLAEAEKAERHEQAARDIEAYRRGDRDKLRRLKDYLARWAEARDPEAARALADLYRLAPELKSTAAA